MHGCGLLVNMVRDHTMRTRALDQDIDALFGVVLGHGKKRNYRRDINSRLEDAAVVGPICEMFTIRGMKPSSRAPMPASFFSE
jgi:hypothetical protein